MKTQFAASRLFRFRLRTLLVVVAFVSLAVTVLVQGIQLKHAAARQAQLQAELHLERARAEANYLKAREAVDQLFTRMAEQSPAAVPPSKSLRDALQEEAREFPHESKAEAPHDGP
jgi:hypothetical protein